MLYPRKRGLNLHIVKHCQCLSRKDKEDATQSLAINLHCYYCIVLPNSSRHHSFLRIIRILTPRRHLDFTFRRCFLLASPKFQLLFSCCLSLSSSLSHRHAFQPPSFRSSCMRALKERKRNQEIDLI